ncbi:metallophosphoesterase family protein [Thermodesulfobacteriota bacterium]
MSNLSRRRFLKQIVAGGAGTAIFPGVFIANGEEVPAAPDNSSPLLLTSPCLVKPAASEITVNIVGGKKPLDCFISFKEADEKVIPWKRTEIFSVSAYTPLNISLRPLKPDTTYEYQVNARIKGSETYKPVIKNFFRTQRTNKSPFSFVMIGDSHITPDQPDRLKALSGICKSILSRRPDFLIMLGDNIATFDSHGGPMTEERYGPALYYMLRSGLGSLPASIPVFNVIGNWEGENGWHPEKYRAYARNARMSWMPGPLPDTYPQGGSKYGDYYGFTWGDTLNLVLNVTGYTYIEHIHGSKFGKADDWTLGESQKQWLYKQLSESDKKWKFIYIHHTVGGKAGDDLNTRYGRGGGQAAYTGEQRLIHEWMKEFNVNALFYGHDHVFTDIPVDGINYICVGSAGAPWKFTTEETGYKKFIPDSGYTWVDVHEDKLKISFIRPDRIKPEGEILHRFNIN